MSTQTIDTRDGLEEAQAEFASEAADGVEGADMEDEETTPAPLDDPHPAEPAPVPVTDDSMADDSARCGNGILDDDELCEIGIPDGEEGACPTECGGDECSPERLEVHGCHTVCLPAAPEADAVCP